MELCIIKCFFVFLIFQTEAKRAKDLAHKLVSAVKQLANTELELLKTIESSVKCQSNDNDTTMSANGRKTRKAGKSGNVNINDNNIVSFSIIIVH